MIGKASFVHLPNWTNDGPQRVCSGGATRVSPGWVLAKIQHKDWKLRTTNAQRDLQWWWTTCTRQNTLNGLYERVTRGSLDEL